MLETEQEGSKEAKATKPKEPVSTRPKRQEAILWKLNRPLYGLTDASRKWCCRMDKEFTRLGCQRSKHDHAVYNLWKGGELKCQIPLHADDPLHGGSDLFHREVISSFMGIFAVGSKEDTDFVHVDWHMRGNRHGITVSQDNYALQDRMKVPNDIIIKH